MNMNRKRASGIVQEMFGDANLQIPEALADVLSAATAFAAVDRVAGFGDRNTPSVFGKSIQRSPWIRVPRADTKPVRNVLQFLSNTGDVGDHQQRLARKRLWQALMRFVTRHEISQSAEMGQMALRRISLGCNSYFGVIDVRNRRKACDGRWFRESLLSEFVKDLVNI